jgi:DNA-binding NtrC family response regulator
MTSKEILRRLRQQLDAMNVTLGILEKIESTPPKWSVKKPKTVRRGGRSQRAPLDDHLDDHERSVIAAALTRAKGNQSEAARLLGMGRDRFRYKLSKHRLL